MGICFSFESGRRLRPHRYVKIKKSDFRVENVKIFGLREKRRLQLSLYVILVVIIPKSENVATGTKNSIRHGI